MSYSKKYKNPSKYNKKKSKFNLFRFNKYKYFLRGLRRYLGYGCVRFSYGLTFRFVTYLSRYYKLNIKRVFIPTSLLLTKKFKNKTLKNFYLSKMINRSNTILVRKLREKNPIYSLASKMPLIRIKSFLKILNFRFYRKNLRFNLNYLRRSVRRNSKNYFRNSEYCQNLFWYAAKYPLVKSNLVILNKRSPFKHKNRSAINGFLSAVLHDTLYSNPKTSGFIVSKLWTKRKKIRFTNLVALESGLRYKKSKTKTLSLKYPKKAYNNIIFYNNIHHKEFFKIRDNEFSSIKYLLRKKYFKTLLQTRYVNRLKFINALIKTKAIRINNKKVKNSIFYYPFYFLQRKSPYLARTFIVKTSLFNRRTYRKKNWKFTKLNSKRHAPRSFLRRSLSFGFFKKQDSFRLLHIFRTIFLKYSFAYSSFNLLKFFKNLKNSLITHNSANTFVDRFLWHIERSANILIFRSKYAPTIKTSNHLIRYGFFMLNNSLITNPYTQVSLLDVIRVAKTKYFLKLFLKDYLLVFGFRKKNVKPFYIELNRRVLALTVFRKPKLNDFILTRNVVSPRPETNWYLALPTISALF